MSVIDLRIFVCSEPGDFHTFGRFKLMWISIEQKMVVSLMETMVATIDLPGSFMTAEGGIDGKRITFIPLWKWLLQVGNGKVKVATHVPPTSHHPTTSTGRTGTHNIDQSGPVVTETI